MSKAVTAKAGIFNEMMYAAPREVMLDEVRKARVSKDRRRMIRVTAIILFAIFVLVGMRAYCANLQHANNELIRENGYLEAEIDSLNSQLIEQINVTKIEKVATDDYGMVFPTADNVIVLEEGEKKDANLAAVIKSEAYN